MGSYKDDYLNGLESHYCDLENRILADIIRRIKKEGEITSTADWQINKLAELGYSSAQVEALIKEALDASWGDMFELYDNAAEWEYVRDKALYDQINENFIPYEENAELQQYQAAIAAQTQGEIANISRSLGIIQRVGNQMTFLPLTEFYRREVSGAIIDIASGAFDHNSVIKRVIKTLANSGVRSIDYASGYSSRAPTAVRRAIMTGLSQITGTISEMNARTLGTDHYEIDWHSGARPSHRVWQGKVYTAEELRTVCGLGTVTGLKGANCYHDYYPFIPGVSERKYTDEWLAEQNRLEDKARQFMGKEYTLYEATQRQRQLETAMRARRQEIHLMTVGGVDKDDIVIAKAKYQGQLAEYKAFSGAMGIKPQLERVYIDGLGRIGDGRLTPIMPIRRAIRSRKAPAQKKEGIQIGERVHVKGWFTDKIDMPGYAMRIHEYDSVTIVEERGKAYKIAIETESLSGEHDLVIERFVPKSVVMTEREYEKLEDDRAARFEDGKKRYEKMIKFAKENGVKGVRVGLRKETILRKIEAAGLSYEY